VGLAEELEEEDAMDWHFGEQMFSRFCLSGEKLLRRPITWDEFGFKSVACGAPKASNLPDLRRQNLKINRVNSPKVT
jgi:hypothetical protein